MAELTVPPSDNFGHYLSPSTTNVTNYNNQSEHNHIHNYVNTQSFTRDTVFGTTIINEQHTGGGHPALSDDVARLFNDIIVDCAITADLEVPLWVFKLGIE